MNERSSKIESASHTWKRLASTSLVVVVLFSFFLFILFRILLLTPVATEYMSHALSRYCEHKVTVAELTVVGQTIYLSGIGIESPPGFKNRKMLSARRISLTHDIIGLVRGKRSLSRLEIVGLSVIAEKNDLGSWNFSSLLRRFTKKKEKPSAEITIRHFSLQDTSLQMNGHKIENLGLTLADFSTKGTTDSKLELSGKDAAGNPLRLTAAGRLGNNPAFSVTADAPAIALAPFQKLLRGKPLLQLEKAQGKLAFSAELRNRLLTIRTAAAFTQLSITLPGGSLPINGHLDFDARYNLLHDSAELTGAHITVDTLMSVKASGSMQRVSKDCDFTLQLTPDKTDLGSLVALLPEPSRRVLSVSGEMSSRGFRVTGNRSKGITAATGDLSLRKVALVQAKQLIVAGGAADFSLLKTASNWQLDGRIFTENQKDAALIESLSSPFTARFSPRFEPARVSAPTIKVVFAGIPLTGSFQYRDTAPVPSTLSFAASDVPLTALNGFLTKKQTKTRLTSGKFTARAKLSGSSLQKFAGKATLDLISATGTSSKNRISIRKAAINATIQKSNRILSGNGSLEAIDGNLDGTPFGAKTGFILGNREVTLVNTLITFAATRIQAKKITGKLPKRDLGLGKDQIPLIADLTGAEVRSGDLAATGISGRLNARYAAADHEPSLVGTSDLSLASLIFRNHTLASATVHLTADGTNALADIRGNSLGGTLSAQANTAIFSKTRETSFSASLLKQKLERLDDLLPRKLTPRISSGTADIQLSGNYTQKSGIEGKLAISGQDISLKGSSEKTLTAGIAASFKATLRGQSLALKEGIINHAQGPSLRIGGTLERLASVDRSGDLSFSMPSTTLNSLLDAFANALPRNLQEASCEGSCTLAGSVELRGANTRINGNLSLEKASLELPSQKISVSGIEGSLPFSLAVPWQETKPELSSLSFSRETYSKQLENHKKITRSGNHISIGTIRFGALETGTVSLFVTASRGIMRVSPIEVNLYEGRLLGSGYLLLKGTPEYGANIILSDVSLKQFCESFPSIKGYITGRIDGILSVKNEQGGLNELTGYVNLWTRSGKGEEMLVSKEFLQKLAGKKLKGFFFQNDRPYDNGEIIAYLHHNYLTFEKLDISHTNFLGMKDLSVSVAPVQNRIALDHLLESIRDAAARGKGGGQETPPVQTDLKWLE
ncbi:MAG: hypothetical protein EHM79_03435 [Geobacter sp.]|nr:MAG: hypothetical protein EHM79_03435 [Geobacter sp.]